MKEVKTFWKDNYSAVSFYMNDSGQIDVKLFSKVYPNGKDTKNWDYVKVGFGASGYTKISEDEFNKVVKSFKK